MPSAFPALVLLVAGAVAAGEAPAGVAGAGQVSPAGQPPPADSTPREQASGEAPRGTLTRPPELESFVAAEYPPDAQAAGVEGAVTLAIVIGEDGSVERAVVVDPGPHPAFAAAALHAVQQFRFRPAEIDGKPAAVEIEYRYEFVLRRAPPAAPAEAPVALEGRVVERGTRSPVSGATVEAGGVTAETDAAGRFALRGLSPGEVTVRIASPEHERLAVKETVEEGKRREVEYRLTRRHYDPYEAVVRGERDRREISVRTLELEEVRTVPGTQGDVLKVIQDLPGVARSPFGIGLLVVRGSDPADTKVYVDGVEIPLLFHFGGLTSVVSGDVIQSLDFYPGNFGGRFGRAIGGSVEIRTREAKREVHGLAQVDIFDGRAQLEGPLGDGQGYLALRRSWVDAVLAVVLPRVAPSTASELTVAPRYYDYQAKVGLSLLGGTAALAAYGSDDALEFVRQGERSGRPTFYLHTLFHRAAASWRLARGDWTHDAVAAFGWDTVDVLQATNFGVLSEIASLTLRDESVWRPRPGFALALGVDTVLRTFDYSVYAPPLNVVGSVGGFFGDLGTTVGEKASGTWLSPGAYLEADWRPVPRLRLVGGLRLDADSRLRHDPVWLDPRASAFLDVREGTTVTAAAGLYGSAPAPQQTTTVFGNPDLGPQHALQLAVGLRQTLPWAAQGELTGFYKKMWSLVTPTRALDPQGQSLHLSNEGLGEVIGLELLLRRELSSGLYGWIAYTLSRAIRRDDPTLPSYPGWHLFALDQTHVLTLVLSYRLPGDWILGTRVRGVSGNPYTPTIGSVFDADAGRFQCIPSSHPYTSRLPGFFQADARVDKRWVFERWMFSMYLDVQNVTNRANAEFRFPNYDCSQSVPIPSVPLFPALGLRAEW